MLTILLQGSSDPAAGIAGLIVFLIFLIGGLVVYFLPFGIAIMRSHPNTMPIFLFESSFRMDLYRLDRSFDLVSHSH